MATLKEIREQIDATDEQLVTLLNRRAELALQVKAAKQQGQMGVYAPERERQILDRVQTLAGDGPFPKDSLERIFGSIISATRSLVGELAVAYIGPEYSLEHEAAIKQFGEDVQYFPEVSGEQIFRRIERGDVQCGVVPARTNSLGLVTKTFDLLLETELRIIAEIEVRERLSLLSRAAGLSGVQRVYSTAAYFSRAESWLTTNLRGAELVVKNHLQDVGKSLDNQPGSALIASEVTAERLSLPALATGIESELGTEARFVVIGRNTPLPTGRDKTSLVCAVAERAGALRDILRPFSERGLTLLKIESRPMRQQAWEYAFFIDLMGHQSEPVVAEAIAELSKLSSFLRILGSYPLVCQS